VLTICLFLLLNSGRLDKLLYVPLPTPDDRYSILKAVASKVNLAPDVDLKKIGYSSRAEGYSGADCAALIREAGLAVLKESVISPDQTFDASSLCIAESNFKYAFDHVVPSVSRKDQARYNRMRNRMAHARSRGAVISELAEDLELEDDQADTIISTPTENALNGDTSVKKGNNAVSPVQDKDGDTSMGHQ
jgi:ribosome biogenesis ATPase